MKLIEPHEKFLTKSEIFEYMRPETINLLSVEGALERREIAKKICEILISYNIKSKRTKDFIAEETLNRDYIGEILDELSGYDKKTRSYEGAKIIEFDRKIGFMLTKEGRQSSRDLIDSIAIINQTLEKLKEDSSYVDLMNFKMLTGYESNPESGLFFMYISNKKMARELYRVRQNDPDRFMDIATLMLHQLYFQLFDKHKLLEKKMGTLLNAKLQSDLEEAQKKNKYYERELNRLTQ